MLNLTKIRLKFWWPQLLLLTFFLFLFFMIFVSLITILLLSSSLNSDFQRCTEWVIVVRLRTTNLKSIYIIFLIYGLFFLVYEIYISHLIKRECNEPPTLVLNKCMQWDKNGGKLLQYVVGVVNASWSRMPGFHQWDCNTFR